MVELTFTTPLKGDFEERVIDVGVITDFQGDFAFGRSENNFQIKMYLDDACLEVGGLVYIENTEVGGIVDSIQINSERKEIVYEGRTIQGILASKIVSPPQGSAYFEMSQTVLETFESLIDACGLSYLFRVQIDTDVEINENIKIRYDNLYSVLLRIADTNDLKFSLNIRRDHLILLKLSPIIDYTNDQVFRENIDYSAKKNYRPVNHLICLGKGNMEKRTVIDLYFDEDGDVFDYYSPYGHLFPDDGFILDNRNQKYFGAEEITAVYDYNGAEEIEGWTGLYIRSYPSSWWKENFENYYFQSSAGYKKYAIIHEDYYQVLSEKPADWDYSFSRYFRKSGNKYVPPEATLSENYELLYSQPSDWVANYAQYYTDFEHNVEGVEREYWEEVTNAKNNFSENYKNYYTRTWDGTRWNYNQVPSRTVAKYKKQTSQPSDWSTNYSSYYQKNKNGGYSAVTGSSAPKWSKKTYYTRYTSQEPALYDTSETYFKKVKYIGNPTFVSGQYYRKKSVQSAPTFLTNVFYQHIKGDSIPPQPDVAFLPYTDHYTDLVENALKYYKENFRGDSIDLTLKPEHEYDLGDIIGAEDYTTGLVIIQKIVKKIYRIKDGRIEISYEEGEALW